MRFQGGKSRYAKQIVELMEPGKYPYYVEPFLGGGWVASEVARVFKRPMFLSDAHPDLMYMWSALQQGWVPPEIVTEEDYAWHKDDPGPSAMRGFVGFGCSFGGKFFGGYAREGSGSSRNFALMTKNSLEKKRHMLKCATLSCHSYEDAFVLEDSLVYCDPPYQGTTGYKTGKFDHEKFWEWVRMLSYNGATVYVSEYQAPEDFKVVAEFGHFDSLKKTDEQRDVRVERVFQYAGC